MRGETQNVRKHHIIIKIGSVASLILAETGRARKWSNLLLLLFLHAHSYTHFKRLIEAHLLTVI